MSEDVRPADEVTVEVNDVRWQMVPADKLSFAELREVKKITGLGLVEFEKGLQQLDGDAWLAWMFVSIKRQWGTLTVEELEASIGNKPFIEIVATLENKTPEVAHDPLDSAAGNGSNGQGNDGSSSSPTLERSTPVTPGIRPSATRT